MDRLPSQDLNSVKTIVEQYLEDAVLPRCGVEERSHLAQLCAECVLLFEIMLKSFSSSRGSWTVEQKRMEISLKRSFGRMKIWSEENGVTDGSLDVTMAASPALLHDTVKYVVSIGQTLTERLIDVIDITVGEAGQESISLIKTLTAAIVEGQSDLSSDSGVSEFSSDSVTGILEDLRMDTTCLMDLEPLIRSPIPRTDPEPAAVLHTSRVTWSPHLPYSDKVSIRFPQAADELVGRLGRANYERYLRCQQQKESNELVATQSEETVPGAPDHASSKFHDSGIGSSLPTAASSYAETVMSYGMGEERKVRVPPLPARAKEGLPFECVACGKRVRISTNSAWKKHIYEDLRPWVCLEADCSVAIDAFPTREDWISHLALDHRMAPEWCIIECPLCRAETGPGKLSVTKHMSAHLEEISLAVLPADCEFDEESEASEVDPFEKIPEVPARETWLNGLLLFQAKTGRQTISIPALSKRSLSLFEVNMAVQGQGGYEKVRESNGWAQVCTEIGLCDDEIIATVALLQNAYQDLVRPYESFRSGQREDNEPSETGGQSENTISRETTSKDSPQNDGEPEGGSIPVPTLTVDAAPPVMRDTEGRQFLNADIPGSQLQQPHFPNPMNRMPAADPLQHSQAQRIMDDMDLPVQVTQIIPNIPPDAKKWDQFKAWVSHTNPPIPDQQKAILRQVQVKQFRWLVASCEQGGIRPQAGAPIPTAMPHLPSNTPLPEVAPQEIQEFRMTQPHYREASEEQIKAFIQRLKIQGMRGAATGLIVQPPAEQPGTPASTQPGVLPIYQDVNNGLESTVVGPEINELIHTSSSQEEAASAGARSAQKQQRPFQCSLCPKRFTRAHNLRSHLRTHTDERPFVCTVCGKAFSRQHDRKRHEGLHTQGKTSRDEEKPEVANKIVPSSYWPVAEMNGFPELLRSFGSDWRGIAQHMTTKTATMVKNFYNIQTSREKPEWAQIVSEAEQKVQRGEKLPDPPPKLVASFPR